MWMRMNTKLLCVLLCVIMLIWRSFLGAEEDSAFANAFNHYSGNQIQSIAIMGERCTGTNFLSALLALNTI